MINQALAGAYMERRLYLRDPTKSIPRTLWRMKKRELVTSQPSTSESTNNSIGATPVTLMMVEAEVGISVMGTVTPVTLTMEAEMMILVAEMATPALTMAETVMMMKQLTMKLLA